MMKPWTRLAAWFGGLRNSAGQQMADQWRKESQRLLKQLQAYHAKWQALRSRQEAIEAQWTDKAAAIRELSDRITRSLESAEALERQHAVVIAALEAERNVLRDCTVAPLAAQNKMLLEQWKAEVAIQSYRQGLAGPRQEQ